MYEWLQALGKDTLVVATKSDKISRGQWQKHLKQIREGLGAAKEQPILLFSAENGQGLAEVMDWVEARVRPEPVLEEH